MYIVISGKPFKIIQRQSFKTNNKEMEFEDTQITQKKARQGTEVPIMEETDTA